MDLAHPTGLDPIESAIVVALDAGLGPTTPQGYHPTTLLLEAVHRCHGYALDDIYTSALRLARPWLTSVRLVELHGNAGSREDEAAEPRYTELRRTTVGDLCAQAHRGDGPGVPAGLILGDTYKGGSRPPFDPHRLVAALEALDAGWPDEMALLKLGPPAFPPACRIDGNIAGLYAGHPVTLRLVSQVVSSGEVVHITDLPPQSSIDEIEHSLAERADELGLTRIWNVSHRGITRIELGVVDETPSEELVARIEAVWGVHRPMRCHVPGGVAPLLRGWLAHEPGRLDAARALVAAI